MLVKNKAVLQDFESAIEWEWLETNGLGGWSGSTVTGAHTRRYHGLLVAAIVPPTDRMVMLSKLDETIVYNGMRTELGTNVYDGHTVYPGGYQYQQQFSRGVFPEWIFQAGTVRLKKTIGMVHGENTVLIRYEILEAGEPFSLELLPLMAARGYHQLQHAGPQMHWDASFNNGIFHNQPDGTHNIFISVPGASYQHLPRWFNNFQYRVEQYRGLDFQEDLFNHGIFNVSLKKGDTLDIIISTDDPSAKNAAELFEKEKARREQLMKKGPQQGMGPTLTLAADQFIVQRNIPGSTETGATIIAGYHWFTDWGRDTMISLPGLCLATGRFEDAKKILTAFAHSVSEGMLPNRFQDNGALPEYNNVDGTLWYFVAVYKYWQATGDNSFVFDTLLPVLEDIINWHIRGTRYRIHRDEDGLLFAGEKGQQLTWMDARIGDWVVTPRMGKPVEIQALWYNALRIFARLLTENNNDSKAAAINQDAEKVKTQFEQRFWNAGGNYLIDVLDEQGTPDTTLRPNQLFALGLPFPLITGKKAKLVLKTVSENLYTRAGLRTLPATDKNYIAHYGGDQWHRDSAYHQGTVWSWLLGPYIDAIMQVNGEKGKVEASQVLNDFAYHLEEGCIGSVSEIFDADAPHHPRGCAAQAWSVAELLRVMQEWNLPAKIVRKKQAKKETILKAGN